LRLLSDGEIERMSEGELLSLKKQERQKRTYKQIAIKDRETDYFILNTLKVKTAFDHYVFSEENAIKLKKQLEGRIGQTMVLGSGGRTDIGFYNIVKLLGVEIEEVPFDFDYAVKMGLMSEKLRGKTLYQVKPKVKVLQSKIEFEDEIGVEFSGYIGTTELDDKKNHCQKFDGFDGWRLYYLTQVENPKSRTIINFYQGWTSTSMGLVRCRN